MRGEDGVTCDDEHICADSKEERAVDIISFWKGCVGNQLT